MSQQHPMQNRLEKWDETRDNLTLTMQRNMYGLGAPIRTLMERRVVEQVSHSRAQTVLVIAAEHRTEPPLCCFTILTAGWSHQGPVGLAPRHSQRKR